LTETNSLTPQTSGDGVVDIAATSSLSSTAEPSHSMMLLEDLAARPVPPAAKPTLAVQAADVVAEVAAPEPKTAPARTQPAHRNANSWPAKQHTAAIKNPGALAHCNTTGQWSNGDANCRQSNRSSRLQQQGLHAAAQTLTAA
jgi:hypothetical protein